MMVRRYVQYDAGTRGTEVPRRGTTSCAKLTNAAGHYQRRRASVPNLPFAPMTASTVLFAPSYPSDPSYPAYLSYPL